MELGPPSGRYERLVHIRLNADTHLELLAKPHLLDTMDKARSLWPYALKDLPMDDGHKAGLEEHWQNLHADFRISA